jgi:hypothetical protein
LDGTQVINPGHYYKLKNGDYAEGRYIYCDNHLVHVSRKKEIGDYTYFIGKIKGINVISCDGYYAHCKSFKDGVRDIAFKKSKDRGADQYKKYTLDTVVTTEEAITMYRIITGACRLGTEAFVSGLRDVKEKYSIRDVIELTAGQYGAEVFKKFFE